MRLQRKGARLERGTESRLGLEQLAPHARVLRALAGEQEPNPGRDAALDDALLHVDVRAGAPFGQRGHSIAQFLDGTPDDGRSMHKVRTACTGGVADILRREAAVRVEMRRVPEGERPEPRVGLGRHREDVMRSDRCAGRRAWRLLRACVRSRQ